MSAVKEIQAVTPYGETDNVLELSIDVSSDAYVLEDVVKIVGDYSFSIWVKSAKSDCLTTFNVLGTSITESITTKWKKVSTTVKIDSLDNNNIDIIPDINTTIYLYEGFLSEGIIDNSWIPAPEDSEEIMESIKSEFNQTANRIEQKVEASDGRITTLSTAIDSVDTEIKNAKGDSASLKARIDGISVIANNADGKITKLEANVNGINGEINDAKGNSTTLKARLEGIEATASDAKGNVSTLKTEVGKISGRVSDTENNISTLTQDAKSLESRVQSNEGDMTQLNQRADGFDVSIKDLNTLIDNNHQAFLDFQKSDLFIGFGDVEKDLKDLRDRYTEDKENRDNWMRFDSNGYLILGAKRKEGEHYYELKITKKEILFMVDDSPAARITGNEMIIERSTVLNDLRIGQFVWNVRGNGNLGLTWKKKVG